MTNKTHGRSISNARKICTAAILVAIATILQYAEIPLGFMPSFIKFDFSDLPALLGAFALGPWYGVCIEFLKNVIHLLATGSMGVGELSNFLLGAFFVLPAGYIYQSNRTKKNALIGSVVGALTMAVLSLATNVFVIYPMYGAFMGLTTDIILAAYQAILPSVNSLPEALLIFNVPFTFVKGLIDAAITFFIYKRISPIILGTHK